MKILLKYIVPLLAVLILSVPVKAQEEVDRDTRREILTLIEENYTPWESVELSGKLKSSSLPLSPSVKIYMEKGVKLDLSIRAPFLGEVGRITATQDTIIAVNKMKKTYWSESMTELSKKYPGGLDLLQNILLGRIYMFGQGLIGPDMGMMLNVYPDGEEGWLLMPKMEYQIVGARYGYVAGEEGEALALIVERDDSEDYLQLDYDWKKNGKYDILVQLEMGSKHIEATLQLDSPKWNALPMNPIAIDSRYSKVTIKEFISKLL